MKRSLVALCIFSLALTFHLDPPVFAQAIVLDPVPEVKGEQIERFLSVITLERNGIIQVQESIEYDFGELERHGIFRKIPLEHDDGRGKISVRNIQVSDAASAPYSYEISEDGGYTIIKIGDPDVVVTSVKTYVLRYEVDGALRWGDTSDELIWNVTGNEWEVPILKASVSFYLFSDEAKEKGRFDCYQGAVGSTEACRVEVWGNPARPNAYPEGSFAGAGFESSRALAPGEGLTFSLTLPKGILIAPTASERALKLLQEYWPLLLPVAIFLFLLRRWWETGRDPKGRGTVIPQYEPPSGLSPIEAGALLGGTVKPAYISAQMIHLATRGFLKITPVGEGKGKPKDYVLDKLKDPSESDPMVDRLIMLGIFSTGPAIRGLRDIKKLMTAMKGKNGEEAFSAMREVLTDRSSVKMSELKNTFHKSVEGIKGAVSQSLLQKKYYDHDPRKIFGIYFTVAFLVFFLSFFVFNSWPVMLISCIVSAGVIAVFGWLMPKVTKQGAIEKENIRGFRNYLDIAEKDRLDFHNAPEKRPELFEKFLPYAMAFGVADAWAKEFKDIYMEPPQWYGGSSSAGPLLAASIAHDMGSFSSAAASTALASGGSGSSGGGSFSGGGAGGGGGGSW